MRMLREAMRRRRAQRFSAVTGRKMFDVPVPSATAGASHQIDLTLSPLPPGEYLLEVVAAPTGPRQFAAFRVR